MKTMRPYISFDIETTGVDTEKVHTLEIGAVIDDGFSPIEDLKTFNVLIKEPLEYTEPYAMNLNKQILAEIASGDSMLPILKPGEAMASFASFCKGVSDMAKKWDKDNGASRATPSFSFAGKNASTFDFPILHAMLRRMHKQPEEVSGLGAQALVEVTNKFTIGAKGGFLKRRFIDLGSVYYDEFGYIPSQDEVMTLLGMAKVNHRAKDDALQVVSALRAKWAKKHL